MLEKDVKKYFNQIWRFIKFIFSWEQSVIIYYFLSELFYHS